MSILQGWRTSRDETLNLGQGLPRVAALEGGDDRFANFAAWPLPLFALALI
jgi:hypothetical protein